MLRTASLIAPYAAWMVLMSILPQTAWAYAVRGLVTAALLIGALLARGNTVPRGALARGVPALLLGLFVGIAVFLIWIAPDFIWRPAPLTELSPYDPKVCGWTLTVAKLCASAFVISIAEELFFRVWLVEFAGFWWMVALFAVEHGERWHVGAITGIAYGLLAKRFGILSAIIAHAVTNLILGLYVVFGNKWFYW